MTKENPPPPPTDAADAAEDEVDAATEALAEAAAAAAAAAAGEGESADEIVAEADDAGTPVAEPDGGDDEPELGDPVDDDHPTRELSKKAIAQIADDGIIDDAVPLDLDAIGLGDEPVPAEATEDHSEEVPPDPGSPDAASPRMQSIVESLLFAADKALTLKQLGDFLGETELARVRAAVAAVEQGCQSRGFQLHQVAGGYQFRTNPDNAQWVQKMLATKPVKLSRAQIETLAICAYRQPVTRPEIDEIRGVDSGGTLKTLLDRVLVRIVGKKEEPGRPILYGTTKEFLEFFNLRDLKDLPTLREFHELSEEHQAQVAALEGVAPAGTIEGKDGDLPASDAPPPLTRLEITTPPEDAAELEEIDRLIRTAGVSTDQDQPSEPDAETASPDEFDHEPTREFDALGGEATKLHHATIPEPVIERVDEEFDHSETTSKKKRPEGLDDADSDDNDEPEEAR